MAGSYSHTVPPLLMYGIYVGALEQQTVWNKIGNGIMTVVEVEESFDDELGSI